MDTRDKARKPDGHWMIAGAAIVLGLALISGLLVYEEAYTSPDPAVRTGSARSVPFETVPSPPAAAQPSAAREEPLLRVAVAPVFSPEASLGLYQGLVDYLAARVGRRGILIQRPSYSEVNSLARQGHCDLALVCTYAYVQGSRDFGLKLIAIPQVHHRTTYQSYVIVGAKHRAAALTEMQGTRLASADMLSNTGFLYPEYVLGQAGHRIQEFFSEIIFTQGHDRAIRAVATGVADCAAVDSIVYDQVIAADPSIARAVRLIAKSPEFGMPPLVVPRTIDPALRERLRGALLGMDATAEGRAVLALIGIDRFLPAKDGDYDVVRKMVAATEEPL